MEQGWDPDVKKYFIKILNTVSLGLLWMITCATAGIYYKLGYKNDKPMLYVFLFYIGMALSLALLIRWFYKIWKK